MTIAICDDEQQQREKLKNYIRLNKIEGLDISVDEFGSGEEMISSLQNEKIYDIVFLDILMKDIDGIRTAGVIHKYNQSAIVILISSYTNYVSEAFREHAFQFLIKPVSQDSFDKEFHRAVKQYYSQHQKYVIKLRDSTIALNFKNIVYIEGYQRHLNVVTNDGKKYVDSGKLIDKEKQLAPLGFVRTHQGFLVNMNYIKCVNEKDILTTTGSIIEMSSRKKSYVLKQFSQYLVGKML